MSPRAALEPEQPLALGAAGQHAEHGRRQSLASWQLRCNQYFLQFSLS